MADFVYFHNLDPFAVHFWGSVGIRWYGLAYIAGILAGWFFIWLLIQKKRSPLTPEGLSSFVNYIICGALIGGRLGYCIFYRPSLLIQFGMEFPFWGVLEIHKGGMASHGGILGIAAASFLFARKHDVSFFHTLDIAVFGGGFGIICGRIANFINAELYGRIIEGKAWVGVQFPKEILSWYSAERVDQARLLNLKEAAGELGSIRSPFGSGDLSLSPEIWTSWVRGGERFSAEVLSSLKAMTTAVEEGQTRMIEALAEVLPIRHPSQIYQAGLEGLFPLIVVLILYLSPKKAGLISGVWGFLYLVMRIFGERFRMPDSHIGFTSLGLTLGQWISLGALIPVAVYLYLVFKNPNSKAY